jgi:hypothetical protein
MAAPELLLCEADLALEAFRTATKGGDPLAIEAARGRLRRVRGGLEALRHEQRTLALMEKALSRPVSLRGALR